VEVDVFEFRLGLKIVNDIFHGVRESHEEMVCADSVIF